MYIESDKSNINIRDRPTDWGGLILNRIDLRIKMYYMTTKRRNLFSKRVPKSFQYTQAQELEAFFDKGF